MRFFRISSMFLAIADMLVKILQRFGTCFSFVIRCASERTWGVTCFSSCFYIPAGSRSPVAFSCIGIRGSSFLGIALGKIIYSISHCHCFSDFKILISFLSSSRLRLYVCIIGIFDSSRFLFFVGQVVSSHGLIDCYSWSCLSSLSSLGWLFSLSSAPDKSNSIILAFDIVSIFLLSFSLHSKHWVSKTVWV